MPPLFNYYKLKRKWNRKKKTYNLLVAREKMASHKDFSWNSSLANPFQDKSCKFNLKQKIELMIIIIAALGMIILWIYHPFFHINRIQASGLQRIQKNELENAIYGSINYRKLFILPGQSYFLININEVKDIIKERFPIKTLVIKKIFPNTISVQLEEDLSTLIYDNGKEYCLIGLEGKVVEILRKISDNEWKTITTSSSTTSTIHIPPVTSLIAEMGDYPIVYDKRNKEIATNNQVLEKDMVKGIIEWFNLINKKTDIPFGYLVIDNGWGEGTIKIIEGWELKVKLNQEIDSQFERLQYLLKTKIQRLHLNYIDLRFKDRTYWQ